MYYINKLQASFQNTHLIQHFGKRFRDKTSNPLGLYKTFKRKRSNKYVVSLNSGKSDTDVLTDFERNTFQCTYGQTL